MNSFLGGLARSRIRLGTYRGVWTQLSSRMASTLPLMSDRSSVSFRRIFSSWTSPPQVPLGRFMRCALEVHPRAYPAVQGAFCLHGRSQKRTNRWPRFCASLQSADRLPVWSHLCSGSSFSVLSRRSHSFTTTPRTSSPACIFLAGLSFVKYVDTDPFAIIAGTGDHGVPGHRHVEVYKGPWPFRGSRGDGNGDASSSCRSLWVRYN